jgi:hypothetical protein
LYDATDAPTDARCGEQTVLQILFRVVYSGFDAVL